MANEAALPHHSQPNSAGAAPATPNSPATIAAIAECKSQFRGMRKTKNAKLFNELKEHSVDFNTIASKFKANSYSEPLDFIRDVRSVLNFGAKSSKKNERDVANSMLVKFEINIQPIISELDRYDRGRSLEIEGAIDDHEPDEFNYTPPKQRKSCTATANEAALPPHSTPNSAAAATPNSAAVAAAPKSAAAIVAMTKSMEKCKVLFQGMREYENAKLLNVTEKHSVDLNTIASKLETNSYSEPRHFARDVESVLEFGKKSSNGDVRAVAAKLLAKLAKDIAPINSEWDVYYWGSLKIEGAPDEHELNEFLAKEFNKLGIDHLSNDALTDAQIAQLEATLQYYPPDSHSHGASTSRDPPNKRRKV